MKSLWKTILDGLTYTDLAGKRQPRIYTIVTGLILSLLFLTGTMALLNHYLLMRKVQATPVPISLPWATQTSIPSPIPTSLEKEVGCPTDSTEWSLTPTVISTNYNVIQPACVYQGLEKTIAWALAIHEGYSRKEATQELGFSQMPIRAVKTVGLPDNDGKPVNVPVSFVPMHPDFTEWRLDENSEPTITYALRGCFRTSNVEGNRIDIWGGDYPVICLVMEDAENTYVVYSLEGHVYTSTATPMRSFLLFGYVSDGDWVWLGTRTSPKLEITDPQANARERLTIATLYDSKPWDARWLMNTWHLVMQSPPKNWQSQKDKAELQTILDLVSAQSKEAAP
jgi:hypothetical protein